MTRVKPLSLLGRKRSSNGSLLKSTLRDCDKYSKGMNCAVNVGIISYCVVLGVALTLLRMDKSVTLLTMIVSLIAAGLSSVLAGLCTAEYLSSQCTSSVYTGCYQSTGEFLAFFIGWTCLASQTAAAAALCKVLAYFLHLSTQQRLRELLEPALYSYADEAPAAIFAIAAELVLLTGICERALWFVVAIPGTLLLLGTLVLEATIEHGGFSKILDASNWGAVENVETVISTTAIFMLFFTGPHSTARMSRSQIPNKANAILGASNIVSLIIAVIFVLMSTQTITNLTQTNRPEALAICILVMIALFIATIEVFHPLHFVIQDMASDGLVCRTLAKKWTPFCYPVAPSFVHVSCVVAVGVVSVVASLSKVLMMAVLYPLFVNSIIPLIVIWQRYRDNNSWQYEPMLQTSSQSVPKHRSRSKSQEFQFVKSPGYDITETTCIVSQEESSDTDIDSVVEQYKDQTRIANLASLENPRNNDEPEPTPITSKRANLCVFLLLASYVVISVIINVSNFGDVDFVSVAMFTLALVTMGVSLSFLTFLPQNSDRSSYWSCAKRMVKTPIFPALASLAMCCLLIHALLLLWKVVLCWMSTGLLVYFAYSARNSTAATSFYNLRSSHLALHPLPNHMYSCIPQVVASHRRSSKKLKLNIRHR